MHERTQRAVARLLFVFCCAVPTSFVLLAILVTWSSWFQSRQLSRLRYELGRETGLEFDIESCKLIAPGKYVLENIRISDPDSDRQVAQIRMIDYFEDRQRVGIVFHQLNLQSAGLGRVWSTLHDRLISRPSHTIRPISIAATDVSIQSRTGSVPWQDISAMITPEGKSVRLIAEAHQLMMGSRSGGRGSQLMVDLLRDREGDSPKTEVIVSTEGTALPCSALAEYSPAIGKLGPDALFTGVIKCNQLDAGWSFDLGSSSLAQLNLSYLTEDLPHRVTGNAGLRMRRCLILPGRTVNMIGTFEAEDIRLQPALLAALKSRLGVMLDDGMSEVGDNGLECKLAAVDFEVTDETMKLTGVCEELQSGIGQNVALYSRGRAVAWTSPTRLNADQITAALVPPGRDLAAWNRVLLPSVPEPLPTQIPGGQIRRIVELQGEASIRQE